MTCKIAVLIVNSIDFEVKSNYKLIMFFRIFLSLSFVKPIILGHRISYFFTVNLIIYVNLIAKV